jgi:hypothetical protein
VAVYLACHFVFELYYSAFLERIEHFTCAKTPRLLPL